MIELTFSRLKRVLRDRGITEDSFVDEFRGVVVDPRDFFKRVHEDRYGDVVVPFRSVIKWWVRERKRKIAIKKQKKGKRK